MKIRYYYDRHTRSYIVQLLDNNNYEVKSEYYGNIHDVLYAIEFMKQEYKINDARKYNKND